MVAGAGERPAGGQAQRRLGVRVCALRDAHGARPFDGEDVSEVLGAVSAGEPDWTALPPDVPPPIRTSAAALSGQGSPAARAPTSPTALFVLEKAASLAAPAPPAPAPLPRSPRGARLPWTVAACSLLPPGQWSRCGRRGARLPNRRAWCLRCRRPPQPVSPPMLAISPDGTHVVALVQDGDVSRLWVRPLARLEGVTLARTDGAVSPFWSPDGHTVGFFADGKLKTVDICRRTAADDCRRAERLRRHVEPRWRDSLCPAVRSDLPCRGERRFRGSGHRARRRARRHVPPVSPLSPGRRSLSLSGQEFESRLGRHLRRVPRVEGGAPARGRAEQAGVRAARSAAVRAREHAHGRSGSIPAAFR